MLSTVFSSGISPRSMLGSYRQPPVPSSIPDGTPPKKICVHCHVTSTSLWRREPSTQKALCNACGLYNSATCHARTNSSTLTSTTPRACAFPTKTIRIPRRNAATAIHHRHLSGGEARLGSWFPMRVGYIFVCEGRSGRCL